MDEEKGTKEEETEKSEGDNDERDKSKTPKIIIDANAAAERLEKANEERGRLLGREEQLVAKRYLGGVTEAGQTKPVEETPEEYAKKVMANEI